METPALEGQYVRLEALRPAHFDALKDIALDPSIWRYMLQPVRTEDDLHAWIDAAIASPATLAWVTIQRPVDGRPETIVGATRFLDLDLKNASVEIGNTWLTAEARGSRVNVEAKLLQLTCAFETLGLHRVAFKTHSANLRSQTAIKSIGARYEGTFRNHLIMSDGSLRDSAWFSIIRSEWPEVKDLLTRRLKAPQ
jgi:RimJ/RimL family protein N-acetyltransferase